MTVFNRFLVTLCCCVLVTSSSTADELKPNAALKYWQAFSTMPTISENLNSKIAVACSEAGFRQKIDKQLSELVSKGEYPLRMLYHGTKIEACDWGADLRADGAETILPHLAKGRQLARLALIRARYRFEQQENEKAIDDIVAAITLGRHISRDGTIIGVMVAYSVEMSAIEVMAAYLPAIDVELAKQALARHSEAPEIVAMPDAITQEEMFLDWAIDKLQADGDGQLLDFCTTLTTSKQQTEDMLVAVGNREQCLEYLTALRPIYAEMKRVLALPADQFDTANSELTEKVKENPAAPFVAPNVAAMQKAANVYACRLSLIQAAVEIQSAGPVAIDSHADPFGEGTLKYSDHTSPGDPHDAYRLSSQLERSSGRKVSLSIGIAAR